MNQRIFGQNKILNHPGKINNWLEGVDDTLITIELDLTNKCNNKCPKCMGWAGGKTQDELTITEVKNFLKQIAQIGVKGITFTGGGEPLLHLHVDEALECAKKLGLHIGLITNGLLLSKHIVPILDNCDWVRVSLDAGTPEMYMKTHGMDEISFNIVLQNIHKIVAAKENSNCVIGIGYLTGKDTVEGMEEFAKLAIELNVDYAQFRPFHDDFTDIRYKLIVLRNKIITASWQKYNRFGDINKRPYKKCYGVNFATTIGADGSVFICCHMRGIAKYKLGNLKKQSLKDIWAKRQETFNRIDFKDCPIFCRCDEMNRLLEEIKKPKQHPEFL